MNEFQDLSEEETKDQNPRVSINTRSTQSVRERERERECSSSFECVYGFATYVMCVRETGLR